MVRVAMVDDHVLFRAGLRAILAQDRSFSVVAEGSDGLEALRIAREIEPDVMLLDVDMPGMSGIEVTRRIVEEQLRVRVLILSMHVEAPFPQRLLDAGALGYLGKGCDAEELLLAIRRIASGRRYLQAELAQELVLDSRKTRSTPFTSLSKRELDVCMAVVRGVRLRDVAHQVGLSQKTVSTYKLRLMEKLGVQNVAALTQLAIAYGMLPATSAGGAALLDPPPDD